jgi:hypothetical protein
MEPPMAKFVLQLVFVVFVLANRAIAQQVPDLDFKPPITKPAYEMGKGPRVVVDAAHHNFHTSDGRYKPLAEFLKRDGYQVDGSEKAFSEDSIQGIDVLVIANALSDRNLRDWSLPTPSAFTNEEIEAVAKWVEEGGSLFLMVDHMPFPGCMGDKAKAFGIEFSNGYANAGHWERGKPQTFEAATGLKECAVTRGRGESEKVTVVQTFGGSAFKAPKDAIPLLVFGKGSISSETTKAPGISPDAKKVEIENWSQGALLARGKGRVAVFGEAAMFSAQLAGAEKRPMGMNAPTAKQNPQLLLNVMHWLSRVEGMRE